MTRFVALFRGINVGKAKRIAMADLRALLGRMGYTEVQTLLNSGNAIFASSAPSAARHATAIRKAVASELGVDALVIVKSAQDVANVITGNSLGTVASDPSRLLVALTQDANAMQTLTALTSSDWGTEALHITPHAAYVWCANGILQSPAATALLKGLAEQGTTRNWATVEKIHALLQAQA
jgi:uncharacterized protein (DUF1697 family)